jgi:HPt (histidine-containing phosphotransfer) domain-containing protein
MVDLSFLKEFTKGNITKMKRYISLYLKMAPESFERMQENIENKSWQELAINAHSFKPQAEYMGITVLQNLMIDIELQVESNQFENLDSLFKKAKSIHLESSVFLNKFLSKN